MSKTLIMCCGMADAIAYAKETQQRGEEVIASSSLHYDESAVHYPAWQWLPSVYEQEFLPALNALIEEHNVARIYCPHNIAHHTLLQLKEGGKLSIPLLGMPPAMQQTQDMQNLLHEAEEIKSFIHTLQNSDMLHISHIAAILRQTALTYGESNTSKLAAFMALFDNLPKGDVVEVGSWWGKSAVALIMLARHYSIGHVLCVDPWESTVAVQKDSPALMQTMPSITDWETVFTGFTVHTAAVAMPSAFNFLRMPSVEAARDYGTQRIIASKEFGATQYTGKISFIHIDGNHDYVSVKADYEAWRPYMLSGGWIVLDDYVWLHGNGVQKLGDDLLQKEHFSHSFVAGKALFLQIP